LDILGCVVGAARRERGEPVPRGLVRAKGNEKGGREMSNEEIVKGLKEVSAFGLLIANDRKFLDAAIARLSATAFKMWDLQYWNSNYNSWVICEQFDSEKTARIGLDKSRKIDTGDMYRVVERQITETVKEW
jgi:hypothetical protein